MARKVDLNGQTPSPLVGVSTQCPTDTDAAKTWPNVIACLFPIWKDGKCCRQCGSIRLRLVGVYYQLTLTCPTEGVETDIVSETLVGIFDKLEDTLRNGKAVWRPDYAALKKTRHARA